MENDFIPGNTPQGNRATRHLLFLCLSSMSHLHSLVLNKTLSKIIFDLFIYSMCSIYIVAIHTDEFRRTAAA